MLPWSGAPMLLEPVPQASKVGCSWLSSCFSGWPTFTKPPHGSRLLLCHCLPLQPPDKFLRWWPDIKLSEDGCFCCWKPVQPSQPVSSATFSLPVSCLISREFHLPSSISKTASWIIPLCPKQERLWLQTDCNNYWGKSKEYFLLSEPRNAHFSRAKKAIVERVDCEMWLITEMLNSGHFFSVLKITNMLSHKHTAALKLGHEPQTSFVCYT